MKLFVRGKKRRGKEEKLMEPVHRPHPTPWDKMASAVLCWIASVSLG